jgi:hypothetical protein
MDSVPIAPFVVILPIFQSNLSFGGTRKVKEGNRGKNVLFDENIHQVTLEVVKQKGPLSETL